MPGEPPARLLDQLGRDVAAGALRGRVGLLPAGSVEWHGPHGPLGTDVFIARALAERVAARRPRLVVLPDLAYAPCRLETRRHPGTLAIPDDLAAALLEQLFRGALGAGLAGVVVLNAHVETVGPATQAANAVTDAFPAAFVALVNWWETLPAEETAALGGFGENGGHGHGGAVEMSVAQAIVPDLVRPEAAPDLAPAGGPPAGVALLAPRHADVPPHGYHGRPSEIDPAVGAVLLERAAERIAAALDALETATELAPARSGYPGEETGQREGAM